jgi:hypothetical protein
MTDCKIGDLRIKDNQAQRLISAEQEIVVIEEKAELRIKRVWRDVNRIFAEGVMVKTEKGWQRLRDLLDPEFLKGIPEDSIETEVIDVSATNHSKRIDG